MSNLIRHYGQFWNPEAVDWVTAGGKLLGKHKVKFQNAGVTTKRTVETNFWEAQGVYALISDFQVVYVGKAFKRRMGPRLRDHLTDRHIGRWDMFSWFSISTYNKGENELKDAVNKQRLTPETIINTLEAVSILISDARLNRKRESIPNADEVFQPKSAAPKSIRAYCQDILTKLGETP